MSTGRRFSFPDSVGFAATMFLLGLGLVYVVWPFMSALLWAGLAAMVFQPLYEKILVRTGGKPNRSALLTLLAIIVMVVAPLLVVATIVVDQAAELYAELQLEEIDVEGFFTVLHNGLPTRLREMLDASGYGEFEQVRDRLVSAVRESLGIIASQAVSIGSGALAFILSLAVGLYVTFFLLRDGKELGAKFCALLPMEGSVSSRLCERSVSIVKATVKGSFVVGLVQGALGTATFWIAGVPSAVLLGVIMALASLLPAIGTGLVWVPVALWLFLTGAIWQGVVVVISGALIIGMADNVLRPILVGRDTGIPDWVILVSTLGGIAAFGLSGIVIGPVIAGLFMAGCSIRLELKRPEGEAGPADVPLVEPGQPA